jgi:hypothetical protein
MWKMIMFRNMEQTEWGDGEFCPVEAGVRVCVKKNVAMKISFTQFCKKDFGDSKILLH